MFSRRSRAANVAALSPIWPNFELVRDFIVVHVTCIVGARVFTTLYINFSDAQRQITPESLVVSGRNFTSFKLLCMSSSPARMKMIQLKMKELDWSNFELVRDVIDVLIARMKTIRSIKMKALE